MVLAERGHRTNPDKEQAPYSIKLAHSLDRADIAAIAWITNGRPFYKEKADEGRTPHVGIKYPKIEAEIALGVPMSDGIITGYLKSGRQKFKLPLSKTAVIIKEKSVTFVCPPEVGKKALRQLSQL